MCAFADFREVIFKVAKVAASDNGAQRLVFM
jgi:hypothetical protein